MRLLVDGVVVDTDSYAGGLVGNENPLVIGANIWSSDSPADRLRNYFAGRIGDFRLLDADGNQVPVSSGAGAGSSVGHSGDGWTRLAATSGLASDDDERDSSAAGSQSTDLALLGLLNDGLV